VSDDVSSPVTFDADDIWILLPRSWREWDEAKLRAVLAHEMAHVQRGDAQNLLLASLATCLFWFHPLSWFLRRQLSALAEEACDEAVLASEATPEAYATFLIDFARDVRRGHGRLVTGVIAMAGSSSLKRRIERLFADTSYRQQGRRVLATLALALFAPALYLTAAARLNEPQEQGSSQQGKAIWPRWEQVATLSAEDAAKIESSLQANPEDLDSRMELLVYFDLNKQNKPFTDQLLWFINHHPSLETLPMSTGLFRRGQQLSDDSRDRIGMAWEKAMAENTDSPFVIFNAASFLAGTDSERALHLLRKAEALDSANREKYDEEIDAIFTAAELQAISPEGQLNNIRIGSESGARLRENLESSHNPALLTAVGRLLVELNRPHLGSNAQFKRGIKFNSAGNHPRSRQCKVDGSSTGR
jgi:hypothetical protein